MNPDINIQIIEDAIIASASDRYNFSTDQEQKDRLLSIAPDLLSDIRVIQLKRNTNETNNWRTILVCLIFSIDSFDKVLKWTADVRDELLDPEVSDLYLITVVTGTELSLDLCTNIESDDKYCRKYILRPEENIQGLLSRTFLNTLTNEASNEEIVDPLQTALNNTAKNMTWFTPKIQDYWKAALLSGKTSADLIENLFTDNFSLNQNDETSTEDIDQ